MRIVSIGEVLWDVINGEEHLGGAPLNFAAHASRLGHDVRFISAVGEDERGERVLARMTEIELTTQYLRRVAEHGTGVVTVEFEGGQPRFTIHRPAAYDLATVTETQLRELAKWSPEWIYFGSLAQTSAFVRETLRRVSGACRAARRIYDVNLRKGCYTTGLLRELMQEADVVKLNDTEKEEVGLAMEWRDGTTEEFCRELSRRFELEGVCVTRGAEGCALMLEGEYAESSGYPANVADTVGAGDAFGAALVHGIGEGWGVERIAEFCNRVGALVASRRGAIPEWTLEEALALKR